MLSSALPDFSTVRNMTAMPCTASLVRKAESARPSRGTRSTSIAPPQGSTVCAPQSVSATGTKAARSMTFSGDATKRASVAAFVETSARPSPP